MLPPPSSGSKSCQLAEELPAPQKLATLFVPWGLPPVGCELEGERGHCKGHILGARTRSDQESYVPRALNLFSDS